MAAPALVRYASAIDSWRYGVHRAVRSSAGAGRLDGRIGSDGLAAQSGRYHVYAGRFCPWSHRIAIQIRLNGLAEQVSISYVDGLRDGRGWAFRAHTGADPVNGFALVREAYEATEAGYDGPVSIPVLWDRHTNRIVSNDPVAIGVDLATRFASISTPVLDTYPEPFRARIEELDRWLRPTITFGVGRAAVDPEAAERLVAGFRQLDWRLASQRFLLGPELTDADVRLWVTLVRYDSGPNAHGTIGPRLDTFPHLWAYARDLYGLDPFRATTDFRSFTAPFAALPDWAKPVRRGDPLWAMSIKSIDIDKFA